MRNKVLAIMCLATLFLTGCTSENDFISEAVNKNKPGMTVYTKLPDGTENGNVIKVGEDIFYGIYDTLMDTSLSQYVVMNDGSYEIDMKMYITDYIENNDRAGIELETEDRINMFSGYEEFWNEYHWVMENGMMYLENSDGQIVNNFAFLFFSKNEEIKETLISNGYESIYNIYESIDEGILEELNANPFTIPSYYGQLYNCEISYALLRNSISMTGIEIPVETEYLSKLHQGDCWVIEYGGVNEICESISMHYSENKEYDEEKGEFEQFNMRTDLYGYQGVLKEMKIIYENTVEKIPEYCQPTLIECMKNLGCKNEEITEFIKELPKESGNIGSLYFIVEKIDKNTCSIKLYTQ